MPQFRLWCFTAYREPDDIRTSDSDEKESGGAVATYYRYQEEIAPTTGRRHWQGYIEVDRRCGVRDIQRIIGAGKSHVEPAKDPEAARDYAGKTDTRAPGAEPIEWGQFGGRIQGERTDLAGLAAIARDRGTGDIIRSQPADYVRYHRGLEAIAAAGVEPRSSREPPPGVTILIGPPGSSKTRIPFEEFGDSEVYTKDASKWWNGYRDQKCILFDDWVGSLEIPPHALLQICDRYPLQVQSKGGYVKMARRTVAIVFTSNIDITEWYGYNKAEWEKALPAFRRRVSKIVHELEDEPAVKVEAVDADAEV